MTYFFKFSNKFGTAIKHNLLWKWVTSEPIFSVISAIYAAVLLGSCAISNQPVSGSIIVRHHNLSGFFPQRIVYGPMRSTHRVSHGFVSACLGGSFPYFWFVVFSLWQVGHFLHTSWTIVQRTLQSKCWRRVCSVRVSPGWQIISWYQYIISLRADRKSVSW